VQGERSKLLRLPRAFRRASLLEPGSLSSHRPDVAWPRAAYREEAVREAWIGGLDDLPAAAASGPARVALQSRIGARNGKEEATRDKAYAPPHNMVYDARRVGRVPGGKMNCRP
jgi:hypothetical protein